MLLLKLLIDECYVDIENLFLIKSLGKKIPIENCFVLYGITLLGFVTGDGVLEVSILVGEFGDFNGGDVNLCTVLELLIVG